MRALGPGTARDTVPGVLILAAAVDNMLHRTALRTLPEASSLGMMGALALALALAVVFLPMGYAFALAAILAAGLAAASVPAFAEGDLVLPLLPGLLAMGGAGILAAGHRYVAAGREQRRLRRSLELFLPPAVVARLLASGRVPALGGEQREITIMFADLAGFSGRAERSTPEQTVALVNRYFELMTEEIERQGGIVDKFLVDAVLAIFGAPEPAHDHAARAVAAALACRARLALLNAEEPSLRAEPLRHRVGINTGPAVVGNVGARRRLSYTAMGDAVNLAQRIQAANRDYATDTLASRAAMEQARHAFAWREVATTTVPGRTGAVTLFEPLSAAGAPRA
jgi:adenylate cyclase